MNRRNALNYNTRISFLKAAHYVSSSYSGKYAIVFHRSTGELSSIHRYRSLKQAMEAAYFYVKVYRLMFESSIDVYDGSNRVVTLSWINQATE